MVELRVRNRRTGRFERVGTFASEEKVKASISMIKEDIEYEVVPVPGLAAGGPSRTMPEDGTGAPDYVPPPPPSSRRS